MSAERPWLDPDGHGRRAVAAVPLAPCADVVDSDGRDRRPVLTVPNLLSPAAAGRACRCSSGCCSARRADGWAIVVLAARRVHRLARRQARPPARTSTAGSGALLDPAVDRLYILAALVGARRCATSCRGGRSASLVGARPGARRPASRCCAAAATARTGSPTSARAPRSCCCTLPAAAARRRRPGWLAAVCPPDRATRSPSGGAALYLYSGGALPGPVRAGAAHARAAADAGRESARVRRLPAVISRGPALHRGPRVGARPRGRRGAGRHHRPRAAPARRRRVRPAARRSATPSRPATPSARWSPPSRSRTSTRRSAVTVVAVNDALADAPGADELRRRTSDGWMFDDPGRRRRRPARRCSTPTAYRRARLRS